METQCLMDIEEQLNRLQTDEVVLRRRQRAGRWVDERLLENALEKTPDLKDLLQDGAEGPSDALMSQLAFSGRKLREYRFLCAADPYAARDWLIEQIIHREQIAFRKENGISPATWKRFREGSAYPEEETLRQIIRGLRLNMQDEKEFRELVIREIFPVTVELRDEVREHLWQRNLTIREFLELAWISQTAWEAFQPAQCGSKTSQGTLLKMVIVFLMTPEEARSFLDIAGSDFVTRRDLVVLACLIQKIYDPFVLYEILEFFSRGYRNERLYQNLYHGALQPADFA